MFDELARHMDRIEFAHFVDQSMVAVAEEQHIGCIAYEMLGCEDLMDLSSQVVVPHLVSPIDEFLRQRNLG